MVRYLFFTSLILFYFISFSQTDKEEDSLQFHSKPLFEAVEFKEMKVDEIKEFHRYRNNFRQFSSAGAGNIGLPFHNLGFSKPNFGIQQVLGAYSKYAWNYDELKAYRMSHPYSSLMYVNGAKREQYFKAFHSQNIGKALNINFQYDRISSEGFFVDQLTDHTRFNAGYLLQADEWRFSSKGYYYISTIDALENGGVFPSSNASQNDNTVLLDINLFDAQNQSRSRGLGFNNAYVVLNKLDSNHLLSGLSIAHNIHFEKAGRLYKDLKASNGMFYDNYLLDTVSSHDSSYAEEFSNQVLIQNILGNNFIGIDFKQFQFFQNYLIDESFNTNYALLGFQDSIFAWQTNLKLKKGLSGYFKSETSVNASISRSLDEQWNLQTGLNFDIIKPSPLIGKQRSNHFFYTKELKNQQITQLKLRLENDTIRLAVQFKYSLLDNWIVYDESLVPQNVSEKISIAAIRIEKQISFWEKWNLDQVVNIQLISNEEALPLPKFYSEHSFYYQNEFFEKSLLFQIGFDLNFSTPFEGYAYNPSQAFFHLRNNSKKIGSIPQLDWYMNMRISKSAKIFVKMENLLHANYNEESNRIINYPVPGRVLKFGLSWRMIN